MSKIVIDDTIPFIEGVFEPFAEVEYLDGELIQREHLIDTDALIIRTHTRCDENLLKGTAVKIISTATSGTENIDSDYCKKNGIFVKNAHACNAGAVSNYVFSALFGAAARKGLKLEGAKLGIFGLGSVGQRVETLGRSLGFKILRHDPFREQIEWYTHFVSIEELLEESDIVSLHIPLNENSRNLVNADFLAKMKPGAVLINTSHGDIVDEQALINAIPRLGATILDVWHNEPNVNLELLNLVDIATPHISGYSLQAKQIATAMSVRAVARFLKIPQLYEFFPQTNIMEYQAVRLDVLDKTMGQITSILQYNYPIFTDDFLFRMSPANFKELRDKYVYRREFYI